MRAVGEGGSGELAWAEREEKRTTAAEKRADDEQRNCHTEETSPDDHANKLATSAELRRV